ncbi:hypothetical protein [Micromonospora cremea]|uniref:Uncharacterized protein n=1 Tax=Micromonospora cremea TaxID=709881 RepID=A0A1N6A5I6_9ACTN|nr:hypothetical protein [Micromonospora cremea]SIN29292.1 hypothetical protein SAMN04489832_4977 [Micromonospora cremea]
MIVEPPRGTFVRAYEPTEMVTLAERRELEIGGIPVIVIFRAGGLRAVYAAVRIRVGH